MPDKSQLDVEIRTTADLTGTKQAAAGMDDIASAGRRTSQSLDRAADSAAQVGTQGRRGGHTAAMGFLELSRAVEDAQYGLRGVLNNIPAMVLGFGGGAGLAGVISLAAVAITQFGSKLLDVNAPVREAQKELDELAEKLKAVAEKSAEGALKGNVEAQKEQVEWLKQWNSELATNIKYLEEQARLTGRVADARTKGQIIEIEASSGSEDEKVRRRAAVVEKSEADKFSRDGELAQRKVNQLRQELRDLTAELEKARQRAAQATAAVDDPTANVTPEQKFLNRREQLRSQADLKHAETTLGPPIRDLKNRADEIEAQRKNEAEVFRLEQENRAKQRDQQLNQIRAKEQEKANQEEEKRAKRQAEEDFKRQTGALGLEGYDLSDDAFLDPNAPAPRKPRTRAEQNRARANSSDLAKRREIDTALRQVNAAFGSTRDGATDSEINRLLDAITKLSQVAGNSGAAYIARLRATAQRIESLAREHDARLKVLESQGDHGN